MAELGPGANLGFSHQGMERKDVPSGREGRGLLIKEGSEAGLYEGYSRS